MITDRWKYKEFPAWVRFLAPLNARWGIIKTYKLPKHSLGQNNTSMFTNNNIPKSHQMKDTDFFLFNQSPAAATTAATSAITTAAAATTTASAATTTVATTTAATTTVETTTTAATTIVAEAAAWREKDLKRIQPKCKKFLFRERRRRDGRMGIDLNH